MCESIAQLGAYVVLQDNRFKDKLPLFGGLENARFDNKYSRRHSQASVEVLDYPLEAEKLLEKRLSTATWHAQLS